MAKCFNGVVGGVVAGTLCCLALVGQVDVGNVEVFLKFLPGLLGGCFAAPFSTCVVEETGLEDDAVGIGNNLCGAVRLAGSFGEILGFVDLLDEGFEWLAGVESSFESIVVGFDVVRCDVAVRREQMSEELEGCHRGVSGVTIAEGSKVDVGDGGQNLVS